jgi:hypothetical protein
MSLPDDYVSEMIARHQIDDATAEALLAGRAVSAELRPLAEVVRTYRRMARQPVRPSAALARQMAAGTFDGSPEHYQPAGATGRGRRRRERRVAPRAALVVVLGGAAAAVAGVTSAGFAGVLPEAAQERFENVVETVTPYEFPQPAGEEAEFGDACEPDRPICGEEVSEDARDGGVDGDEVSDRAREQGEDRRPDELPTVAPGQPGEPSSGPAPADQVVPTPPPPGSGTVPTPPVEERRPITPPGDNQS